MEITWAHALHTGQAGGGMRKRTLFLFTIFAGCSSLSNPNPGSLGNGKFGYTCTGTLIADASYFDTQCAPGVFTAPNFVPAAVAVGATFGVTYSSNRPTGDETVISGAPSIVALTGGHFEAMRTGNVALVGMRTGVADDFVYVRVANIASIKVALESSTKLVASPLSSEGTVLGGKLACSWSWSSSDARVIITSTGRKAQVIGPANTSASITASCGSFSGSLVVQLTGGPSDAGADGASEAGDAASDGSSDSGPTDGGTNG
jgi:hypothetical protein